MKNGQKVKILSIDKAALSENASGAKTNRFQQGRNWQKMQWTIFMIGESDNIVVIVNEEGLYVSIPIEDLIPQKKVYLAGPMTGILNNNEESFTKYEKELSAKGFDVINPNNLHKEKVIGKHSDFMKVDLPEMIKCDAVALMSSQPFQRSKGCRMEIFLAIELGMPIIDVDTLEVIEFEQEHFLKYKKK